MEYRISQQLDEVKSQDSKKLSPENTFFWSRAPGKLVDRKTGQELELKTNVSEPQFITIREWYETLVETIIDAHGTLFKRHLQAPSVLEVGPDVLTILEHTMGYEANCKRDQNGNAVPGDQILPLTRGKWVGTLNNRLKVVKVDSMPANKVCVVLITDVKITPGKHVEDPHKPLNSPTSEEAETLFPVFDPGFHKPLLPRVDLIPLQRLDEFAVHVLDMIL